MSWELIHHHLLQPSESVMKSMCHHQTLDGLPKHCTNKINKAPCIICYTAKITTFSKGTTVDNINFQPEEIVYMNFVFYNVTSIRGFTSMLNVVYKNTRMIWLFTNVSKWSTIRNINSILTTLKNEQQPWKLVRVNEDGAL